MTISYYRWRANWSYTTGKWYYDDWQGPRLDHKSIMEELDNEHRNSERERFRGYDVQRVKRPPDEWLINEINAEIAQIARSVSRRNRLQRELTRRKKG